MSPSCESPHPRQESRLLPTWTLSCISGWAFLGDTNFTRFLARRCRRQHIHSSTAIQSHTACPFDPTIVTIVGRHRHHHPPFRRTSTHLTTPPRLHSGRLPFDGPSRSSVCAPRGRIAPTFLPRITAVATASRCLSLVQERRRHHGAGRESVAGRLVVVLVRHDGRRRRHMELHQKHIPSAQPGGPQL